MTPPLGGGGALWTTAAATPDAPPAQPDAGDPALLACPVRLECSRRRITPVG
ncbi:MAG: hypothetical protein ACRDRB_12975 [Pseudonocardiaceae bacterium]